MSKVKSEQEISQNPKRLTAEGYKRRYLKNLTSYRKQQSQDLDNALPEWQVTVSEKKIFLEKRDSSRLRTVRASA